MKFGSSEKCFPTFGTFLKFTQLIIYRLSHESHGQISGYQSGYTKFSTTNVYPAVF